ncbi:glycosyltransferase family protein [Sulfitobacter albidus]|uniref:glycosyltransferase family protein n=1 Tax=Sulfitobacter albidus TaxID=2829501 RepID=UPI0020C91755|nr:glycosyltransferase [Sulfitobacter albidus]
MKIMIVVTHLLGTGHLARALNLGRAFAAAGDRVQVVSGGGPVPHFDTSGSELIQLPPVQSNGTAFTQLLTPDGPADTAYLAQRAVALREAFDTFAPDVLMTELFPFGRRILRQEYFDLLRHARTLKTPPLILGSIRDILAPPSKPSKAAFADETVRDYYDAVLVHSDPALTTLDLSWPVSDTLAPFLRYTGFVAPPAATPHPMGLGAGEVLVSAGGGDLGDEVYETALAAADGDSRNWRLLVGAALRMRPRSRNGKGARPPM